jgi:hypothetical protein
LENQPGFLERFDIFLTTVATMGGLSFRATEFCQAAMQVRYQMRPVKLEDSTLDVRDVDGTLRLVIENPKEKAGLIFEEMPIDLFSTDGAIRRSATPIVATRLDIPRREQKQFADFMERGPDPEEFINSMVKNTRDSHQDFYGQLVQKMAVGEVRWNDLFPSGVALFRRFLRMTDPALLQATTADAVPVLMVELVEELPLHDALLRLSTLPINLPKAFLERVDAMDAAERKDWLLRMTIRPANGTLFQSHLLHLLFRYADDEAIRKVAAERLQDFLKSCEVLSGAFLRVLSITESELWIDPEFRSLPRLHRLLFAWAHSSKVFRVMEQTGVELSRVRKEFGTDLSRVPLDMLTDEIDYLEDIGLSSNLRPWSLALALVNYATHDGLFLPLEEKENLSEYGGSGAKLFVLLRDTSRAKNAMGTFLSESSGWPSLFSGDAERLAKSARAPETVGELAENLLTAESMDGWFHLDAIIHSGEVPPEAKDAIKELISRTDHSAIWHLDPTSAGIAIQFCARHAYRFGDDVIAAVAAKLTMLSAFLSSISPSKEVSTMESAVLSAGFFLYRGGSQDGETRYSNVALIWTKILDLNPRSHRTLSQMVERLVTDLPNRDSRHLWRLLIRLRGTPEKLQR